MNLKKISVIFSVFLLVSCSNTSSIEKSTDGYFFRKKEFVMTSFQTEIIILNSKEEMKSEVLKRKNKLSNRIVEFDVVASFSVIDYKNKKCKIYTLDPTIVYQPEIVGHELYHCIFGNWH